MTAPSRRRVTAAIVGVLALLAGALLVSPATADSGLDPIAVARVQLANCEVLAAHSTGSQHTRAVQCVADQKAIIALLSPAAPTPTVTPTVLPTATAPGTTPPATTPPVATTPPATTPPATTPPAATGCPAYPAVPDAGCTGWRHTGVALKQVGTSSSGTGWHVENGNLYVDKAGTIVDGLDIPYCVVVLANNVTIQRSRITCSSTSWVVRTFSDASYSALTMTDVEIDGKGSDSSAIFPTAASRYTRLDVHGFATSGPRLASDNTIVDSWIHDFVCLPGGHSAGLTANDGGANIVVRHNQVDPGNSGCMTAALEFAQDFTTYNGGSYTNVVVTENLFNGGKYCAYAAVTAPGTGNVTNMAITGNTFGRKYQPECGDYGPLAQWESAGGNTFSGNTWGAGVGSTHKAGDPVTV